MKHFRFIFMVLLIIVLFLIGFVHTVKAQIREEVNLVTVPVTVMNYQGALVTGLHAGDFRLFEDGEEQEILYCSIEDTPVSIVIVFDHSGSMKEKINISIAALQKFLAQANLEDEFSLIAFSDAPTLDVDWTGNPNNIIQALLAGEPKGKTSLIDALYMAIMQMRSARNSRKAILLITDGGDNHSRYNETDIKRAIKETDIQLYAIGIFGFDPTKTGQLADAPTEEELNGPVLLRDLTDLSGGLVYIGSNNQRQLENIATHLGRTLRDQYILTYRPSRKKLHDGKYHKLKVKFDRLPRGVGPLVPFARYGYKGQQ